MNYDAVVKRLFGRTPVTTFVTEAARDDLSRAAVEAGAAVLADFGDAPRAVARLADNRFAAIGETHAALLGGDTCVAAIGETEQEKDPPASVRELTPVEKKNAREHVKRGRKAFRFGRFKPGMAVTWNGERWIVYDARARGGSRFTLMLVSPDYTKLADEVPTTEIGEGSEGGVQEAQEPSIQTWTTLMSDKDVKAKIQASGDARFGNVRPGSEVKWREEDWIVLSGEKHGGKFFVTMVTKNRSRMAVGVPVSTLNQTYRTIASMKVGNYTYELVSGESRFFVRLFGNLWYYAGRELLDDAGEDYLLPLDVTKAFDAAIAALKSGRKPADESQSFTPAHLEQLRTQFAQVKTVDPSSPTYDRMIKLLDGMSQHQLKQVAGANIKFLSKLALNRVKKGESVGEARVRRVLWSMKVGGDTWGAVVVGPHFFATLNGEDYDFEDGEVHGLVSSKKVPSAVVARLEKSRLDFEGDKQTARESVQEARFQHGDRVRIHYKNPRTEVEKAFQGKVGSISGEERDGRTRMFRVKFNPPVQVPGVEPVTSDLWSVEFLKPAGTAESFGEARQSDRPGVRLNYNGHAIAVWTKGAKKIVTVDGEPIEGVFDDLESAISAGKSEIDESGPVSEAGDDEIDRVQRDLEYARADARDPDLNAKAKAKLQAKVKALDAKLSQLLAARKAAASTGGGEGEGEGKWRTTQSGHKIFIDGDGKVTKGNPHVIGKAKESVGESWRMEAGFAYEGKTVMVMRDQSNFAFLVDGEMIQDGFSSRAAALKAAKKHVDEMPAMAEAKAKHAYEVGDRVEVHGEGKGKIVRVRRDSANAYEVSFDKGGTKVVWDNPDGAAAVGYRKITRVEGLDEAMPAMKRGQVWTLSYSGPADDPDLWLFVTGSQRDGTPEGVQYDVSRGRATMQSFRGYNGKFTRQDADAFVEMFADQPADVNELTARRRVVDTLARHGVLKLFPGVAESVEEARANVAGWSITVGAERASVRSPDGDFYTADVGQDGAVEVLDSDDEPARVPGAVVRAIQRMLLVASENIVEAKVPHWRDLASELLDKAEDITRETEVHLRVSPKTWDLLVGPQKGEPVQRGVYWGEGTIDPGMTPDDARELAVDLLDQVRGMRQQDEGVYNANDPTPFDSPEVVKAKLAARDAEQAQKKREAEAARAPAEKLAATLTADERKVLAVTTGYIPAARRKQSGLSQDAYDAAVAGLKAKKLMNAQGALTPATRELMRALDMRVRRELFGESELPKRDQDSIAKMAPGAIKQAQIDKARRDAHYAKPTTAVAADWDQFEGVLVMRRPGSQFVAVPVTGKKSSKLFDVIRVEGKREHVAQIKSSEVGGFLARLDRTDESVDEVSYGGGVTVTLASRGGREKLWTVRKDGVLLGYVTKFTDTRSSTNPWKAFRYENPTTAIHPDSPDAEFLGTTYRGKLQGAVDAVLSGKKLVQDTPESVEETNRNYGSKGWTVAKVAGNLQIDKGRQPYRVVRAEFDLNADGTLKKVVAWDAHHYDDRSVKLEWTAIPKHVRDTIVDVWRRSDAKRESVEEGKSDGTWFEDQADAEAQAIKWGRNGIAGVTLNTGTRGGFVVLTQVGLQHTSSDDVLFVATRGKTYKGDEASDFVHDWFSRDFRKRERGVSAYGPTKIGDDLQLPLPGDDAFRAMFLGEFGQVDETTYYLIRRNDGKFLDGMEWVDEDPGFGFRDMATARKAASDEVIRGKLRKGQFQIVTRDTDDVDEAKLVWSATVPAKAQKKGYVANPTMGQAPLTERCNRCYYAEAVDGPNGKQVRCLMFRFLAASEGHCGEWERRGSPYAKKVAIPREGVEEGYQHVHFEGSKSARAKTVMAGGKTKSVQGRTFDGVLLVHPTGNYQWGVTHIPTGFGLVPPPGFSDDREAVKFAKAASALGGWDFTDPQAMPPELPSKMSSLIAAFRPHIRRTGGNAYESVDESKSFKISTKDPATMTPAEINREKDKLSAASSELTDKFIEMGRGHWKQSDIRAEAEKGDELSRLSAAITNRQQDLTIEIEARYGPNAPSRLPLRKGFGPRKKAVESAGETVVEGFAELLRASRETSDGLPRLVRAWTDDGKVLEKRGDYDWTVSGTIKAGLLGDSMRLRSALESTRSKLEAAGWTIESFNPPA